MVKISAGSYDINKWLRGGYEKEVITTFYGSAGTGKTNFCVLAAASQAGKGNKVIYIDTEGGFSVERVRQITDLKNGEVDKILENILLLKPTNFEEQKKSFNELLKYLKEQVSLVIVDGMTMLYRLEFASAREKDLENIQKVNHELTRQMRILAEIARKHNLPVIVTNQVYNWDNATKLVGGDILKYWSKCLIELTHEDGKRTAHLKKHRSLPESSFAFQVYDGGIRKRGWI